MTTWLFIDTSVRGKVRAGILNPECTHIEERQGRSHLLLDMLLRSIGRTAIRETSGVCVVAGPGSFSSVRGGVLVANLLARCFGLPLFGITSERSGDLARLVAQLEKHEWEAVPFVDPVYDAEPHITVKQI